MEYGKARLEWPQNMCPPSIQSLQCLSSSFSLINFAEMQLFVPSSLWSLADKLYLLNWRKESPIPYKIRSHYEKANLQLKVRIVQLCSVWMKNRTKLNRDLKLNWIEFFSAVQFKMESNWTYHFRVFLHFSYLVLLIFIYFHQFWIGQDLKPTETKRKKNESNIVVTKSLI